MSQEGKMKEYKRYLVTSALPYANGPVHIGHLAGVYVPSDIYVRYLRKRGRDVIWVCGSDEHGVPITIKARREGISPQDVVDKYHKIIKESFEGLGISFDIYSRTTSPVHAKTASDFFLDLYNKGEFTEETTMQYYDEEAGIFLADRYITGTCPKCGSEGAYGDQCEKWLTRNEDCVVIRDFRSSTAYKSMWESEKHMFSELGIEYCAGLRQNDDLAGIIAISGDGHRNLNHNDLAMLSSVSSVASIAIKNARLYEAAWTEARTDELTGLLNRKYFYEILDEEYEKNKEGSLALILFNIDDFKLYNQLYGNQQGDVALRKVADIIQASVGEQGYVARHSAKEFAVLMPNYDIFSARNLAESIQKQILHMRNDSADYKLKILTVSVGISAAPYAARSAKELLDNADLAVYHVKRSGKNGIEIFDTMLKESLDEENAGKKSDHEHIYQSYESTIYALTAAIDTKDHYTFGHSNNVAYYATSLAKALNYTTEMVEIIRQAALLHDVGKIGIPEHILNKEGKLTDEEYEIMKGHVEASIGIIRHLPSLDYVIPAVIGHHERYDGNGYPRRIAGEDIPASARILCIADSFDAMTSKRCYKELMPVEKALRIIREEEGKQFDPDMAEVFIHIFREGKIHLAEPAELKREEKA